MAVVNTGIGSSLLKFTFTDEDGDVVASFRMNPADVKLAHRCQEISSFFEALQEKIPANATLEDAVRFNDDVEEKFSYLLGYDAKASLFGLISATSIMADGELFATHVMNAIAASVLPEIQKRKQSMAEAVAKYTEKYAK